MLSKIAKNEIIKLDSSVRQASLCRSKAALFDFSFVRIIRICGFNVDSIIEKLASRDISKMKPGTVVYCLNVSPSGRVLSDFTLWKISDSTFDIMTGSMQDVDYLAQLNNLDISVSDLSNSFCIYSIQGPSSLSCLMEICDSDKLTNLNYYDFCDLEINSIWVRVGRLGYTGERGFELIVQKQFSKQVWKRLLSVAESADLLTADILRIEAGFILFCNELSIKPSVSDLSMERLVTWSHDIKITPSLHLVCFKAKSRNSPILWHQPYPRLPSYGEILITSACISPICDSVLGLGFVNAADLVRVEGLIDPFGEFFDIVLCEKSYFDPEKIRVKGSWTRNFSPTNR